MNIGALLYAACSQSVCLSVWALPKKAGHRGALWARGRLFGQTLELRVSLKGLELRIC